MLLFVTFGWTFRFTATAPFISLPPCNVHPTPSLQVDLVAVLPFELVGLLFPNDDGVHVLEPRFKVLRLIRITKIVKQINVHDNVVRVSQMLGLFFVFAHVVGSLWWSIGAAGFNSQPITGRSTGTSWVIRAGVDSGSDPVSCLIDGSLIPGCSTSALGLEYASSLYWSLTTLIKTPWVHPDTILEKIWASLTVVVGAIMFAAILGNITAMINSFDKSNAQLRDMMSTLHRLISKYDVPAELQKRVFMYVQTQWSTTKGLDNQRILAKLPPALRGDLLEAINADLIKHSPIFQCVSHECVRVVLSKLRSEVCLAKETLLAPGQLCSEVFLLVRGVLQCQPAEDDQKVLGRRGKLASRAIERTGALVGMRDPFHKDFRYPFHVVAVKQAQLMAMSSKDLHEVFSMGHRPDIDSICEVLEREYEVVSLALTRGMDDENERYSSIAAQRRRSSPGIPAALTMPQSDHDEVHSRIAMIEDTLQMCDAEILSIRDHLDLLPRLCELLKLPMASIEEAVAASEDRRATV